jgi:plastocyanin
MFMLGACGDDTGSSSSGGAAPEATGGAVTTAATSGDPYSGGYAIPPDVSDQAASGGAAADGDPGTVVAKGVAYNPTEITVKVGDTITFENQDGFAHTFTADDGDFDSGNVDGGAQFQYVADEAGTIAFHCKIHGNMKGTITVEA